MIFDKKKQEDETFEIHKKVYSKLNQGRNVYLLMRMFKWKVEKYLRTFRTELLYDEEKKYQPSGARGTRSPPATTGVQSSRYPEFFPHLRDVDPTFFPDFKT